MEESIKVLQSVLSTEKATRLMQTENKITFIVEKDANKIAIRKEVDALFGVKAEKVNIINSMAGRKLAIVKLKKENNAMDIATKLGLI